MDGNSTDPQLGWIFHCRMAVPMSRIFHARFYFCTMRGSGDMSPIYILPVGGTLLFILMA